jgi:hypothetical protein
MESYLNQIQPCESYVSEIQIWGETIMTVKKKPSGFVPFDDLDRDIAFYESMSEEEINQELARQGVDADETVNAVLDLVHAKLEEWRHRGLLHPKAVLMFCAVLYAVCRGVRLLPVQRAASVAADWIRSFVSAA